MNLCRFVAGSVAFGFFIGMVCDVYSGDFTDDWIIRQQFMPIRVQELFATHEIDTAYA